MGIKKDDKKSIFRIVAGICFAIVSIYYFANFRVIGSDLSYVEYILELLLVLGVALVAFSMFVSKSILSTVGSSFCCIYALYYTCKNIKLVQQWIIFANVLFLAFWVLLLIIGISQRSVKKKGIAASVIAILRLAVVTIATVIIYGSKNVSFISLLLNHITYIVGALMLGLSESDVYAYKKQTKTSGSTNAALTAVEKQIECLIDLESQYDRGLISIVEYEEKKKEILEG